MATDKNSLTRNGVALTREDWQKGQIDPSALPAPGKALYDAYAADAAKAKASREKFETWACSVLDAKAPAGQRTYIGFNFGKLTVMYVDGRTKAVSKIMQGALGIFKAA